LEVDKCAMESFPPLRVRINKHRLLKLFEPSRRTRSEKRELDVVTV
jgi:hypothetical protein